MSDDLIKRLLQMQRHRRSPRRTEGGDAMTKGYSMEVLVRVYDDTNGYYYEIRPDADGLDCVAICTCDGGPSDKAEQLTAMSPQMARLVAQAMIRVADEIEAGEPK